MYADCVFFRIRTACLLMALLWCAPAPVQGQPTTHQHEPSQPATTTQQGGHQHPTPVQKPQDDHAQHKHPSMRMFPSRESSGTAWLPASSPMYGIQKQAGGWDVMTHGSAFVQFLYESGDRGSDQFGSINWVMGMARRELAGGRFGLRGMFSLEPLTIRGCGYPDLLASGEICDGEGIHDRQHPHDLFMELAGEYDRPLRDTLRLQIYGGVVGEPALGPVAYPHRLSAMPNPLAPISHHWLDATHFTFGVVTGAVYDDRWKAEASVFNGREPDDARANVDFAAMDSYAGRLWFLPTPAVTLQVSAGHLSEAEAAHESGSRVDVNRVTASATYHRSIGDESFWASTVAWGRNVEDAEATDALLVETNLTLRETDSWFGRFEVACKPGEDLDVPDTQGIFTVAKLHAGYTRYFAEWRGLKPGVGGSISAGIVPRALQSAYGNRVNMGLALFVTLRPAAHQM